MKLPSISVENIKAATVKAAAVAFSLPVIVSPLMANAATFDNQINQMQNQQLIAQSYRIPGTTSTIPRFNDNWSAPSSKPTPPLSSLTLSNVNCSFGGVCDGTRGGHTGVDFRAYVGTEVRAICDGRAKEARTQGTTSDVRNRFTILEHSNCGGYQTLYGYYGHINSVLRPNQQVRKGEVIGYVASYGNNNDHLHFGAATKYFTSGWGYGLQQQGWIDPISLFR